MKRLTALLMLTLGSQALGSSVPASKLLDLIGTAQRRVLVYIPYLTDAALADALRAAQVDTTRPKLKILVITVPFFAAKEDALTNSLALIGVPVIEAQVASTTAYALVDDHLFSSASLGRTPAQALQLRSAAETNLFLSWFQAAVKAGRVITPIEAFNRIGGQW